MRITVTLVSSVEGGSGDVTIDAPPGATLGEVAGRLTAIAGRPGAPIFSGTTRLGSDCALGTAAIRSGCLLGVGRPGPRSPRPAGVLALLVVGGPDAGAARDLRPGTVVVIGRDHTADLVIDDPDVSRRHLAILTEPDGISCWDLGSTNGSTLDGVRLPGGTETPVPADARIRVGRTTLTVAGTDDPPATVVARPDGAATVRRPPRLAGPGDAGAIVVPSEPARRTTAAVPLVSALAPLVLGGALAWWMRSPLYLLFMLLSPVMVLGNAWSERRGARRGRRRDRAEYAAATAAAEDALAAALTRERRARRSAAPDLAVLRRIADRPTQRIWERRRTDPDALVLRIGTADLPARVPVEGRADGVPVLPDVPVVVPLVDCGVLGIAGPAGPVLGLTRSLIAQAAVLHSPDDLGLAVLVDRPEDWAWLRWLPHLDADEPAVAGDGAGSARLLGEMLRVIDGRERARPAGPQWPGPRTLVIASGRVLAEPAFATLLRRGPEVGIHALCLGRSVNVLPAACGGVAVVAGETGGEMLLHRAGTDPIAGVTIDALGTEPAERIARRLAPLRDLGADESGGLPARSRLLDLLGALPGDAVATGASARFVLGESAAGPLVLDLARHGPHVLIAGTTGAGKSELLQTMIASLAVANAPDRLAFVLIDYKGGAAFRDCARLPHTAGMVTDLDPHLTERAIVSLSAELRRRERVLADAGVPDIDALWARSADGARMPPRLVLVVDEFATLADELPDFVDGLVGIAMRGRSLGIHLVLATQRPGGVVSPLIRANTNLRIALRVTDAAESADVIDGPDAAAISAATPGRAVARIGAEGVVAFQTAHVGAPLRRRSSRSVDVRRVAWPPDRAGADPDAGIGDPGRTDLADLVDRIRASTTARARRPWLPPLPRVVTERDLPAAEMPAGDLPEPTRLPFALADRPAEQRRTTVEVDLAAGTGLLIAGAARTGRTTALRTLAIAAAGRLGPEDLHVYLLDCAGGGLRPITALPHCGAYCDREDPARGERLLARLGDELDRRKAVLAAGGFGSPAEQRAARATGAILPYQLLLLDGWDGFMAAYDGLDAGPAVESLHKLIREGPGAGLIVAVAGDRAALTARVPTTLGTRIALALPDRSDYGLLGIRPRQVPIDLPPGRGLLAESATEVQILAPAPGHSQAASLRALAESSAPPAAGRGPIRLVPLPERVPAGTLSAARRDGPLQVVLGLGGDTADPVTVDLDGDGPGFLIAGPPGSGRSTALSRFATELARAGVRVVVIAPPRSPLGACSPLVTVPAGAGDAIDRLDDALAATTGPAAILVDDVELIGDLPLGERITGLMQARAVLVVAAGHGEGIARSYRGLGAALRQAGAGLLLAPVPADGELLGVRLPRRRPSPVPGRGVLVVRRHVVPVQVAAD